MTVEIIQYADPIFYAQKTSDNEKIVRKALVKIWTEVLNKYASPKMEIPPTEEIREELIEVGVKAGVDALQKHHFYYREWMVTGQVRETIEKELDSFDLDSFLELVKIAQDDRDQLAIARTLIKTHILH